MTGGRAPRVIAAENHDGHTLFRHAVAFVDDLYARHPDLKPPDLA